MRTIHLKNAKIITMNKDLQIVEGDLLIRNNIIENIGIVNNTADETLDCSGKVIIPGFIQVHTHLCQTLFRGMAENLQLLDWLYSKILPLENAHDPDSLRCSALLGCCELIKGGTTTILDMGTVHHTEQIFIAVKEIGLRAYIGKAMMDMGEGMPQQMKEDTDRSIGESVALIESWHNKEQGRLRYAFAPRFALSCTPALFTRIKKLADNYELIIHTHSSENQSEIQEVEKLTGKRNINFFRDLGLTDQRLVLAHCIWLDSEEYDILARDKVNVAHCPGCNLKLGSGIANIPDMLDRGIVVGLGADGAPCNNNMSMFNEMRLASLIQRPLKGPSAMPAQELLKMATINGARVLGRENDLGSIEPGKLADLIILDLNKTHSFSDPDANLYSRIVFSASPENVDVVFIDGIKVYENKEIKGIDETALLKNARTELNKLKNRL